MIHGFHFIFSAYGFWLPNDPRGSWSETVRQFDLRQFGPATKVTTTHSVAGRPHDYQLRQAGKRALRYPPVKFTGEQAIAIAQGFAKAITEKAYSVHALAIMPDHVHLVMAYHSHAVEKISGHLKSKVTFELSSTGRHPLQQFAAKNGRVPTPWARNYWCPFIKSVEHMRAAIRYVEQNPIKSGLRRQNWSLVTPYGE